VVERTLHTRDVAGSNPAVGISFPTSYLPTGAERSLKRITRLYGEQNGKAKLTRRQVKSIKQMLKDKADGKCDLYLYQIARLYGVSATTVSYLKDGGRWDDVRLD
jgi:hypothetical protein